MSIKYGLLALLDRGPKYGYQLRAEFERATGATWPLNIGQVYTTLTRLDRDELVHGIGQDTDGRVMYEITDAGKTALADWFTTPLRNRSRPRDELAIKLALAVTVPGVDVGAVLATQRTAAVRDLQELTRLKRDGSEAELSWLLVLESMIFRAEAEIRWLDHCEARLRRAQPDAEPTPEQTPATRPELEETDVR